MLKTHLRNHTVSTVQLVDGRWETLVFPKGSWLEVEGITNLLTHAEAFEWHKRFVAQYS